MTKLVLDFDNLGKKSRNKYYAVGLTAFDRRMKAVGVPSEAEGYERSALRDRWRATHSVAALLLIIGDGGIPSQASRFFRCPFSIA